MTRIMEPITGHSDIVEPSRIKSVTVMLLAMVFVSDPIKKTLPVTLTYFVGPYATNYVQMFAAIIIAIAPTVIVYCLFSNQIVEGLTTGAVKG